MSHDEMVDFLEKKPDKLIKGSKVIGKEFRVVKGRIDLLLKKDDVIYIVEVKSNDSLYSARKQLWSYGGKLCRFWGLVIDNVKLKYIVVKIQKYTGNDVYIYNDEEDLMKHRLKEYEKIHYNKLIKVLDNPEVKKKTKNAIEKNIYKQWFWKKRANLFLKYVSCDSNKNKDINSILKSAGYFTKKNIDSLCKSLDYIGEVEIKNRIKKEVKL